MQRRARFVCLAAGLLLQGAFVPSFPRQSQTSGPSARQALSTSFQQELSAWAEESGIEVLQVQPLKSSEWAQFHRLSANNGSTGCDFFVKSSPREVSKMFLGEALGLQALAAATELLRVPQVVHVGNRRDGLGSFLILEYLQLGGRVSDRQLGRAMGALHLAEGPKMFGFGVNNTIGETPQRNLWCSDWVDFFREHRLKYQVDLTEESYASYLFNAIAPDLELLFHGLQLRPSLLHGDFWGGNVGSSDGRPAVFDPAAYYGHHEAEWGMSAEGFLSEEFWAGYRQYISEDAGFEDRRPLYRAYHQLNHFNLFGGDYLTRAIRSLEAVKQSLTRKK